jgi:Protein of unknown function (DUF669)
MSQINWADIMGAADEEMSSVPDGDYEAVLDRTEMTTSQNGKDMIKCVFHVEGGPYDGKPVTKFIVISTDNPKAMFMVLKQLNALGLSREWIASTSTIEEVEEKLRPGGQRCGLKVTPDSRGDGQKNITIVPASKSQAPTPPSSPSGFLVPPSFSGEPPF